MSAAVQGRCSPSSVRSAICSRPAQRVAASSITSMIESNFLGSGKTHIRAGVYSAAQHKQEWRGRSGTLPQPQTRPRTCAASPRWASDIGPVGGDPGLAEVRVGENESFESALRRFNKKIQQSGILAEARRREHYEKPSVKRKRKEAKRKKNARTPQG